MKIKQNSGAPAHVIKYYYDAIGASLQQSSSRQYPRVANVLATSYSCTTKYYYTRAVCLNSFF
jgi:hypothetical protein